MSHAVSNKYSFDRSIQNCCSIATAVFNHQDDALFTGSSRDHLCPIHFKPRHKKLCRQIPGHFWLLYLYIQESSCCLPFFRFHLGASLHGSNTTEPACRFCIPLLVLSLLTLLQRTANNSNSKLFTRLFLPKGECYLLIWRQWYLVAQSALNSDLSSEPLFCNTTGIPLIYSSQSTQPQNLRA